MSNVKEHTLNNTVSEEIDQACYKISNYLAEQGVMIMSFPLDTTRLLIMSFQGAGMVGLVMSKEQKADCELLSKMEHNMLHQWQTKLYQLTDIESASEMLMEIITIMENCFADYGLPKLPHTSAHAAKRGN